MFLITIEKLMRKQNGEIMDDVDHRYIDHENKNSIVKNFKFGLMDEDLHITNFDNSQLNLTNIFNSDFEKSINVHFLTSTNPLKTWQILTMNLYDQKWSESQNRDWIWRQKRVTSTLNVKIFDFYVNHENIFKLSEKYQPQRSDKKVSKFSKLSKTNRQTEDQFNYQVNAQNLCWKKLFLKFVHNFVLNLSQRLYSRSSNKHVTFQNFFI